MNIFVGNLPVETTEEDIHKLFATYGEVEGVKIILDFESGSPKGYAFVYMADDKICQNAISELDGKLFQGIELKVNIARTGHDRRVLKLRAKKKAHQKKHKSADKPRGKQRSTARRSIVGRTRGDDDRLKDEQRNS